MTIAAPIAAPSDAAAPPAIDWPAAQLVQANLAALRPRDAALADRIAGVSVPEEVHLVRARDGSVNYRFGDPDGRMAWLGGSSVPRIAAEANAPRIDIGAGNLLMNRIGHGADVHAILGKLGPHQALIVVEPELLHVRLALGLHDFRAALHHGRLVLLVSDDPAAAIERFYRDDPGYQIVDHIVSDWSRTEADNQRFIQQATLALENAAGHQHAAIKQAYAGRPADTSEAAARLRAALDEPHLTALSVTNYAAAYDPSRNALATDLLAGFAAAGASVHPFQPDSPDKAALPAHAARFAATQPHLIVLVDALRGDVPLIMPPNAVCLTLLQQPPGYLFDTDAGPAQRLGPLDVVAAPTHAMLKRARAAGLPAERLLHLPPAANPDNCLSPEEGRGYSFDVCLIAERPSTDPEDYQIKLPTHQKLWAALAAEIRRCPADYHAAVAERFLTRAERCGVRIQDDALRDHLLALIRGCLAPAVLLDVYAVALQQAGLRLAIFEPPHTVTKTESGWDNSLATSAYQGRLHDQTALAEALGSAAVFMTCDPDASITPLPLQAVTAGALLLARKPAPELGNDDALACYLPDDALVTFAAPDDLIRKARHFCGRPDERGRKAAIARSTIMASHTVAARAQAVCDHFRGHL